MKPVLRIAVKFNHDSFVHVIANRFESNERVYEFEQKRMTDTNEMIRFERYIHEFDKAITIAKLIKFTRKLAKRQAQMWKEDIERYDPVIH